MEHYQMAFNPDKHLTHEQAQHAILECKKNAIQLLIDQIDKIIDAHTSNYGQILNHTEMQVIAYYASRTSLLEFKQELLAHKQEAWQEYTDAMKKSWTPGEAK